MLEKAMFLQILTEHQGHILIRIAVVVVMFLLLFLRPQYVCPVQYFYLNRIVLHPIFLTRTFI